jgi:hypothetical protein
VVFYKLHEKSFSFSASNIGLVMEFAILRAANSAVHPVARRSLPLHAGIVCTCTPQKILPRRQGLCVCERELGEKNLLDMCF